MTHRLIIAMLSVLSMATGAAASNVDPDHFLGRWREITLIFAPEGGLSGPVIDIAACDEAVLCGREVTSDGKCGPIVLTIEDLDGSKGSGTLTADNRVIQAAFEVDGDHLTIVKGHRDTSFAAMLSRTILLAAYFERDMHEERCEAETS